MLSRLSWIALSVVLGLGGAATPALAQDAGPVLISIRDRQGLEARVDEMRGLVAAGQFSAMTEFLPPRIIAEIADIHGLTVEQTRAASREAADALMREVTFLDYDVDLAGARTFVTPDGSRPYVIVDLTLLMESRGIRMRAVTPNLAFMDEGVWYILDVTDPAQAAILRRAYPEFEGVEFEAGTMEIIEP